MIEFFKGVFRRMIRGPRDIFPHGYGIESPAPRETVLPITILPARPLIGFRPAAYSDYSNHLENLRAKELCRDLEETFGFSMDGRRA